MTKYACKLQGFGLLLEGWTMLSRKVVTRSGRGFRGYFPSKKLNRSVEFESILERDAIELFERDAQIISYQEQPELVYYHDKNYEPRKYYPDFMVEFESGLKFHIEIKPAKKLGDIALLQKYQAISKSYDSRVEIFRILTNVELHSECNHSVVDLLDNDWLKESCK